MSHRNNIKPAQRFEANPEMGFLYPCLAGTVCREDTGGSMYVWALFKRSDVDPELIRKENETMEESVVSGYDDDSFDLGTELTGWGQYSNGVGRWFGSHPVTIIGRNHILVRQFRAMDI